MAMNRMQFQRGLAMVEFMDRYGTDEKCTAALVESRWPAGFCCLHCGDERHSRFVRDVRTYWQCHRCHTQTTVTAVTIFQSSRLPEVCR